MLSQNERGKVTLYCDGIAGVQDILDYEPYRLAINYLINGEYKSAGLSLKRSSSSQRLFTLRVKLKNRSNRLLFVSKEIDGKNIFIFLEVIKNHDYQKSRFLNNPAALMRFLDEEIPVVEDMINDTEKWITIDSDTTNIKPSPTIDLNLNFVPVSYYDNEYVILNNIQAQEVTLPTTFVGPPGSGKTLVIKELLGKKAAQAKSHGSDKIVQCVAKVDKVVSHIQKVWDDAADDRLQPMVEVKINTYNDLIKQSLVNPDEFTLVDKPHTIDWLKKIKYLPQSTEKNIDENIENIYQEFRIICRCNDLNEYLDLGKKQSLFPDKRIRKELHQLYLDYSVQLYHHDSSTSNEEKIIHPAFYQFPQEAHGTYGCIVVDEAQDLSQLQLKELFQLCHGNICYCTDSHQNLGDVCSITPYLLELPHLLHYKNKMQTIELSTAYRCPLKVTEAANTILKLKFYITGGAPDKHSYVTVTADPTLGEGKVMWLDKNHDEKLLKYISDGSSSTDFAIVVPDELLESFNNLIKNHFGSDENKYNQIQTRIFTPSQIKGLQYKTILIYRPWDVPICKEMNKKLREEKKFTANRAKETSEMKFAPYLSQIYTSAARSYKNLIIYQPISHDNENIIAFVKEADNKKEVDKIEVSESTVEIEFISSSPEVWLKQAKKLFEEANYSHVHKIVDNLEEKHQKEFTVFLSTQSLAKLDAYHAAGKAELATSSASPSITLSTENKEATKEKTIKKENNARRGKAKRGRGRGSKAGKGAHTGRQATSKAAPPSNPIPSEEASGKVLKRELPDATSNKHTQLPLDILAQVSKEKLEREKKKTKDEEELLQCINAGNITRIKVLLRKKEKPNVNIQNEAGYTPLMIACMLKNQEIVELLLDKGADANIQSHGGTTALYIASQNGRHETVKLLLNNGADANVKNNEKTTALYIASQHGHHETVKLLLNNGADANIQNNDRMTALIIASENGHRETVKLLLNNGADANIKDNEETTALYIASQNGHRKIVKLLLDNGADANIQNDEGTTALFVASQDGRHEIVELLLDNGADANIQNDEGNTALCIASQYGHHEVVKLLLDKGAHANIKSHGGTTALYIASQNGRHEIVELLLNNGADANIQNDEETTALYIASQNSRHEIVKLLLDKGAHANIQNDDGNTALIIASENGHHEIVKLLLDKGADVNIQNNEKTTALYMASQEGHHEIVKLLLDKGAHANIQNDEGNTALFIASEENRHEIVKLLLDKGAHVNIQNNNGATALLIASQDGHHEIVRLLLDKKADPNIKYNQEITSLTVSATMGHQSVISLLLNHDNLDMEKNNNYIAFYSALMNKRADILKMLLDRCYRDNLIIQSFSCETTADFDYFTQIINDFITDESIKNGLKRLMQDKQNNATKNNHMITFQEVANVVMQNNLDKTINKDILTAILRYSTYLKNKEKTTTIHSSLNTTAQLMQNIQNANPDVVQTQNSSQPAVKQEFVEKPPVQPQPTVINQPIQPAGQTITPTLFNNKKESPNAKSKTNNNKKRKKK